MKTVLAYCNSRMTATVAITDSETLRIPTGESTTTGAGSPGAPTVGASGWAAGSRPSSDVDSASAIRIDCTWLEAGGWRPVKVADFDFHLPDALIAQHALPRGESKLLVLDRHSGVTAHARIRDLARYLRSGDLLVANDSRVFPARLLGHRVPSGGAVECLLLAKEDQPPTSNL